MAREVIFAPEALTDLFELYDRIAIDSPERAHSYTDRIVATCRNLVTFPERGTRRDDLRPSLRTTTYRRRITETQVVIDRVFYGGRNWPALFAEGDDDGS